MKLNQFHVVKYEENEKPMHSVCYHEPDTDVNSKEFKDEFGFPENALLQKIPEEEWTVSDIEEVMDAFFDDHCKSGPYYDPSNFETALADAGLDAITRQKAMLQILKIVEQQFGY